MGQWSKPSPPGDFLRSVVLDRVHINIHEFACLQLNHRWVSVPAYAKVRGSLLCGACSWTSLGRRQLRRLWSVVTGPNRLSAPATTDQGRWGWRLPRDVQPQGAGCPSHPRLQRPNRPRRDANRDGQHRKPEEAYPRWADDNRIKHWRTLINTPDEVLELADRHHNASPPPPTPSQETTTPQRRANRRRK